MSRHRYRRDSIVGDYIRAAVGAAFCGLGTALGWDSPIARWLFLALTAFFVVFAARTLLRQVTEFELTDTVLRRSIRGLGGASHGAGPGVSLGRFDTVLPWAGLRRIRLRYYSTRRDRTEGWMALTVTGGAPGRKPARISLESTVEGFREIAQAAAAAAVANRLDLPGATASNFSALDIRLDRLKDAAGGPKKPDERGERPT